jgi:pimeloyl-ACP methyl ester carboxylesterase
MDQPNPTADDLQLHYHAALAAYNKSGDESPEASVEQALTEADVRYQKVVPFYKKNQDGSTDIAGYVIKTAQGITVSYRGTDSSSDVKRDLNAAHTRMTFGGNPDKVAKVHAGFKEDYLSSKESMEEAMRLASGGEELPISFTGHSLGGAVAQLAALDYAAKSEEHAKRVRGVYTYGAPRVFKHRRHVELYDQTIGHKTLHILVKGDIVPKVPPASARFQRTGFCVKINLQSKGLADAHSMEDSYSKANNEALAGRAQRAKINLISMWPNVGSFLAKQRANLQANPIITHLVLWDTISSALKKMVPDAIKSFWNEVKQGITLSAVADKADQADQETKLIEMSDSAPSRLSGLSVTKSLEDTSHEKPSFLAGLKSSSDKLPNTENKDKETPSPNVPQKLGP